MFWINIQGMPDLFYIDVPARYTCYNSLSQAVNLSFQILMYPNHL